MCVCVCVSWLPPGCRWRPSTQLSAPSKRPVHGDEPAPSSGTSRGSCWSPMPCRSCQPSVPWEPKENTSVQWSFAGETSGGGCCGWADIFRQMVQKRKIMIFPTSLAIFLGCRLRLLFQAPWATQAAGKVLPRIFSACAGASCSSMLGSNVMMGFDEPTDRFGESFFFLIFFGGVESEGS